VLPKSDPPASTLRSLLLPLPPRLDVFCVYSDDNEDATKLCILYVHISNDGSEFFVLSERKPPREARRRIVTRSMLGRYY